MARGTKKAQVLSQTVAHTGQTSDASDLVHWSRRLPDTRCRQNLDSTFSILFDDSNVSGQFFVHSFQNLLNDGQLIWGFNVHIIFIEKVSILLYMNVRHQNIMKKLFCNYEYHEYYICTLYKIV